MRREIRRALAALVSVAAVFAIAALSRVPYGLEERERAVLRLSWRIVGERVQECRPLTPEEEVRLPRHMRPPEICEGQIAPYALTLWVDGGPAAVGDTIRSAGAREDRPIYVSRELELAPGIRRLRVQFRPLVEFQERASLEFDQTLRVVPGEVVLLTYDSERGDWIVRRVDVAP